MDSKAFIPVVAFRPEIPGVVQDLEASWDLGAEVACTFFLDETNRDVTRF
jgi:hypothetical protein